MGSKRPWQPLTGLRSGIQQLKRILSSTGPQFDQLEGKEGDDEVPTAEEVAVLRKDISDTIRVRDLSYFLAFSFPKFVLPLFLVLTSFGDSVSALLGHRTSLNSTTSLSRIPYSYFNACILLSSLIIPFPDERTRKSLHFAYFHTEPRRGNHRSNLSRK